MALTIITSLKMWADPRATKEPRFRTKLLTAYLYTDKKAARHDLRAAKKHFPTLGWSLDYCTAEDKPRLNFY